MIEQVEKVGAEAQALALGDPESLADGKVHVGLVGSDDAVAGSVAVAGGISGCAIGQWRARRCHRLWQRSPQLHHRTRPNERGLYRRKDFQDHRAPESPLPHRLFQPVQSSIVRQPVGDRHRKSKLVFPNHLSRRHAAADPVLVEVLVLRTWESGDSSSPVLASFNSDQEPQSVERAQATTEQAAQKLRLTQALGRARLQSGR